MARTFTLRPYQIRSEIYPVAPTIVAPDATVALATCDPLAYQPSWPTTEIQIVYTFIGDVLDSGGAGSNPQVIMVSDPGGAANIRGQSIVVPVAAGLNLQFSWMFRGQAPDSPAFDDGQTLQLQGLNPGGAGNVSFNGFLRLDVFAQEAP